jgi:hypothetical protein
LLTFFLAESGDGVSANISPPAFHQPGDGVRVMQRLTMADDDVQLI